MKATLTRTVVERPILYSGSMVRAILEDRKTKTRRVAKLPPDAHVDHYGHPFRCLRVKGGWHREEVICPYGLPGDRLWVRETWQHPVYADWYPETQPRGPDGQMIAYRAENDGDCKRWRPSIFMPRWASRLTLELTAAARVERLQDISAADCHAEGIELFVGDGVVPPGTSTAYDAMYRDAYWRLWDSLNAKRGYGFDLNPLVWVLEFAKVTA